MRAGSAPNSEIARSIRADKNPTSSAVELVVASARQSFHAYLPLSALMPSGAISITFLLAASRTQSCER